MVRPRVVRTEYTLPWSRTDRDICMDRTPVFDPDAGAVVGVRERYNIPQELAPIHDEGFGWGGDMGGGLNLAACILDRWLGRRPGDVASYYGVQLACRQLVICLMPAMYVDLLMPIGWHGGVIPGERIAAWIAAHREAWELNGIDLSVPIPGEESTPTTIYGGI